MGVEEGKNLLQEIAFLKTKEKELVEKFTQGINFGENFVEREKVLVKIKELESLIPSSGEQGMTGEYTVKSSHGPEQGRFRKKE